MRRFLEVISSSNSDDEEHLLPSSGQLLSLWGFQRDGSEGG